MYYRITFQNDNGYAFDHVDARITGSDESVIHYVSIIAHALHPIGASGRYTFRKLSNDELGPRKPESTKVQAPCLNPGDVVVKCDTFKWMSGWRVIHCQTRSSSLTRGYVRVYLERESDGTVAHSMVPSKEMVEVLR